MIRTEREWNAELGVCKFPKIASFYYVHDFFESSSY